MRVQRRTTLKDVAQQVGVSVNTASFVLNNSRSGTRVSNDTRAAIWSAARQLGYRPNGLARSLQRRRTNIIGFYTVQFDFLSARNLFLSELVGGLQEGCAELGLDLLIQTIRDEVTPTRVAESLTDRRADGLVILAPFTLGIDEALVGSPVPVIGVVDRLRQFPSVVVDDVRGGQLQADYLASRGHKVALYRHAMLDPISSQTRRQAFNERCRTHGIEVQVMSLMPDFESFELSPSDLKMLSRATALVAWEDDTAYGSAEALRRLGVDVGRGFEVVGFNHTPIVRHGTLRLPSVVAPWREVGKTAVRRLNAMVEGEEIPLLTQLPVQFARPNPITEGWTVSESANGGNPC